MDRYGDMYYQGYEWGTLTGDVTYSSGMGSKELDLDDVTVAISNEWLSNFRKKVEKNLKEQLIYAEPDNNQSFTGMCIFLVVKPELNSISLLEDFRRALLCT